jgi:hypothetical protein
MFALFTSLLWSPSYNIGLNESHGMRGLSFNPDDDQTEARAEGEVTRCGNDSVAEAGTAHTSAALVTHTANTGRCLNARRHT